MKFRKIIALLLLFVLIIGNRFVFADINEEEYEELEYGFIYESIISAVSRSHEEPEIHSRSAVILDRSSGEIIWGKDEHIQVPMASTTKIMTALVLIEQGDLSETVSVDRKAAGLGGSRLGLRAGDKITMHDLLYGLMLASRQ